MERKTIEDMARFLHEAIEGALGPRGSKDVHRRRYGNVPQVTLTEGERDELRSLSLNLEFYLLCLADLEEAERDALKGLMATCFLIGQQTQYGPAVVRSALASAKARTAAAREKHSKSTPIIERHWRAYIEKHPGSRPSAVARQIESSVSEETSKAGLGPRSQEAIARAISRLQSFRIDE